MELLLAAVSYKDHGACLAGFTQAGQLVRPLSDETENNEIPWDRIAVGPGGRNLRPLDVVKLSTRRTDYTLHFEDEFINEWPIAFVREFHFSDLADIEAFRFASKDKVWFMNSTQAYVVNPRREFASLALVEATGLEIKEKPSRPGKYSISFTADNKRFENLSFTDLRREEWAGNVKPNQNYWLCISLALPIENKAWPEGEKRCYKLVAGLWESSPMASTSSLSLI